MDVAEHVEDGSHESTDAVASATTGAPTTPESKFTPLFFPWSNNNLSVLFHRLRLMSGAYLQHDQSDQGRKRSVDSAVVQEVSLPPRDPTALHTNSPYRFHNDFFVTSTEEVRGSHQSPPTYHRIATSSQVQVALASRSFTDLETPPYRSHTNLGERDDKSADSPVVDEKAPLKGVHYPPDLTTPPVHRPAIIHVETDAASVAGTDDEYEENSNYDWSGEEDLVDEEAKFEEQMGNKPKRKGWGAKRYAQPTFIPRTLPVDKRHTPELLPSFFHP